MHTPDCEFDAFLHLHTSNPTRGAYLRFSLSREVPWYLAAGVSLFAYGAPELGTMRFLRDHECAAVVDGRDPQLLRGLLRDFVGDGHLREALGTRARLIARDHIDVRVQREEFRRVLAQSRGERYLRRKPLGKLSAESAGPS